MSSTAYRVITPAPVPAISQGHFTDLTKKIFPKIFMALGTAPHAVLSLKLVLSLVLDKNGLAGVRNIEELYPINIAWLVGNFGERDGQRILLRILSKSENERATEDEGMSQADERMSGEEEDDDVSFTVEQEGDREAVEEVIWPSDNDEEGGVSLLELSRALVWSSGVNGFEANEEDVWLSDDENEGGISLL